MRILMIKGSRGAGLGDHLRALNYAIELSLRSQRKLCIDWRDTPYCNEKTNLFDALFELSASNTIRRDQLAPDKLFTVCPRNWGNNWNATFSQVHNQLYGSTWNYERALKDFQCSTKEAMGPSDIAILWSGHAKDETSSQDNIVNYLATHIRINANIQTQVDNFISHNFADKMIGLHVRMTNERSLGRKSAPLDLYLRKIKQLRQSDPHAGIFLATDNSDAIDFFRERVNNLCVAPKWMPRAGQAIHLAEENKSDGIKIAREAMVDLLLLARCDWIVYPKESSFSSAAALFSNPSKSKLIHLDTREKLSKLQLLKSKMKQWVKGAAPI